jgi:hypothetical protein
LVLEGRGSEANCTVNKIIVDSNFSAENMDRLLLTSVIPPPRCFGNSNSRLEFIGVIKRWCIHMLSICLNKP